LSDLSGKVALVTGGSQGIGLGIVQHFIELGAKVVACANHEASLSSMLEGNHSTAQLAVYQGDVSISDDMQAAVAYCVATFGAIDILVNSAGIQRYGTVVDTPEDTWDDVMNVNLKGVFLASKFAIPEMHKRGGGSVINIASVQAYASQSNVAAYTASKGAIVALTSAMALDHAEQGIRVNAICPASVDTPMLRNAAELWKGEGSAEKTLADWGACHSGKPREIAAVAALMAGDDCPFMTGSDVKVDGGVLSKIAVVLPESS
jgi:NAD(P)-dependent dehydrogenase (short-subunit alcohol dehydrogenase family)